MAKLGLPDENFWNQKQPGDLPKASLAQPFGDTGQRMTLGNWMTGKQADTTFPSAVKTIPERDLPMYNMRFDGQKPIDLGAGYMENKTQNNSQQSNTQQPLDYNPVANGNQFRVNLGGQNFIQGSNAGGGFMPNGDNRIQGGNMVAMTTGMKAGGMDRIAQGLKERGGLNAPKAPTQSAEAQAAGTTDFWLNHNKADQVKADINNRNQQQNQQAQIQNLMNMALTAPNGSMSPSEWNAAARNQKAAQMMLGQLLGANQAQQALQAHMADNAANREVGLAGARNQGIKNQHDYELAMANFNRESAKPFVTGGGQEWDEKAGAVINRPQRIFNYDTNTGQYQESLGGGLNKQPNMSPEYQAAFAEFKRKYPNASDEDIHAAMASK